MTFKYRNCQISISADFNISIKFGETEIFDQITATSIEDAKELARQQIDLFIEDLPPALSYKHSK